MKQNNIVADKSKLFAIRIVNLYKYLCTEKKEYVISKQILRSGTSIGANIKESIYAQSKMDFISKLSIALKEASESEYWLELLFNTNYISQPQFESIHSDCVELIKLLTSIIKSSKS
ncbi:MAG: four helix bundle protein [Ruminococcus sp.]|nr:four helix bundle protein [Ruminococcus sp.]MCD7800476.1 four helix bundle protein [Ruminococcus sp.]